MSSTPELRLERQRVLTKGDQTHLEKQGLVYPCGLEGFIGIHIDLLDRTQEQPGNPEDYRELPGDIHKRTIPEFIASRQTLTYVGLAEKYADQIWSQWVAKVKKSPDDFDKLSANDVFHVLLNMISEGIPDDLAENSFAIVSFELNFRILDSKFKSIYSIKPYGCWVKETVRQRLGGLLEVRAVSRHRDCVRYRDLDCGSEVPIIDVVPPEHSYFEDFYAREEEIAFVDSIPGMAPVDTLYAVIEQRFTAKIYNESGNIKGFNLFDKMPFIDVAPPQRGWHGSWFTDDKLFAAACAAYARHRGKNESIAVLAVPIPSHYLTELTEGFSCLRPDNSYFEAITNLSNNKVEMSFGRTHLARRKAPAYTAICDKIKPMGMDDKSPLVGFPLQYSFPGHKGHKFINHFRRVTSIAMFTHDNLFQWRDQFPSGYVWQTGIKKEEGIKKEDAS